VWQGVIIAPSTGSSGMVIQERSQGWLPFQMVNSAQEPQAHLKDQVSRVKEAPSVAGFLTAATPPPPHPTTGRNSTTLPKLCIAHANVDRHDSTSSAQAPQAPSV
jgi:hypothetical protein